MPIAIAPHYKNKRPLPLLYHGKKSKHTDIKNKLTVNVHNVSLRIRCIIDRSNRSNLSKSIKPLRIAETYKIRSKPLRSYQTVKISKQLKIAQAAQCTKQWTTNVLNWPDFLFLRAFCAARFLISPASFRGTYPEPNRNNTNHELHKKAKPMWHQAMYDFFSYLPTPNHAQA